MVSMGTRGGRGVPSGDSATALMPAAWVELLPLPPFSAGMHPDYKLKFTKGSRGIAPGLCCCWGLLTTMTTVHCVRLKMATD